jgi:hypothetical protein
MAAILIARQCLHLEPSRMFCRLVRVALRLQRVACLLFAVTFAFETTPAADAADKHWNVSSGIFQSADSWFLPGAPGLADHALIGDLGGIKNGDVYSSADVAVGQLTVTDGMTLNTGAPSVSVFNRLAVSGTTTISGYNSESPFGYPSQIVVWDAIGSAPEFTTNNLTVSDSAKLTMAGGVARIDGVANFGADANLWGEGTVNLTSNAATAMVMNGGFVVDDDGLTINQLGTGRIDLDGGTAGDETIHLWQANNAGTKFASLTITGDQLVDAFDDHIQIRANNKLNMLLTNGWTIGSGALVTFETNDDFTGPSMISGGQLTFNGTMVFDGTGAHGQINAPIILTSSAVATLGASDRLELNSAATISGGTYTVPIKSKIDFDGTTLVNGGTFTTTGSGLDQGVVNFNGPTTWNGTTAINGFARQMGNAIVSGATVINGDRFDFDGGSTAAWIINAGLTLNANALETVADFFPNRIDGAITVNGGNLLTPAFLEINLPAGQTYTINAPLTLNAPAAPFVATTLRGSAVTFTSNVAVDGNNASTARINVSFNGQVTIAAGDGLNLIGGTLADPNTLTGGAFLGAGKLGAGNDHALVGAGAISNAIDFDGNAELRAKGGALTLTGAIQDVGVIGTANATGILKVANPWNSSVAQKVELLGGQLQGAALTNDGQIAGFGTLAMDQIFNNGVISSVGGELVIAPSNAGAGPDLDGAADTGVLNAVDGNLKVVDGPVEVFEGIANVGAGRTLRMVNGWSAGGELNLTGTAAQPAVIAGLATLHLSGEVNVNGKGRLDMPATFTGAATLDLDIGGTTPAGEFDLLEVTGPLILAGTLDLSLTGGFVPTIGQAFDVISAVAGVTGQFTKVIEPPTMPAGLLFDVVYLPNLVRLVVVEAPIYSADFDLDGDVDGDDLTVWKNSVGPADGADADNDGDSDGADFLAWQRQFGSVPAVPALTAVPEPTALLGFTLLGLVPRNAVRSI